MKGRTPIDVGSFVPYREVTESAREETNNYRCRCALSKNDD